MPGPKPLPRPERIAPLRARGLTLQAIGAALAVEDRRPVAYTPQTVRHALRCDWDWTAAQILRAVAQKTAPDD